jgi:L-ascorbate 6-phosphate lactonase
VPGTDDLRFWWLGQAGFRVEIGPTTFVIDPWASPHEDRLIPPPPLAQAAEGVDVLLVTHEHLDHLDLSFLPTVLERSPSVLVVLPAPLVELGDVIELGGVELRVVPAHHGVTMEDAYGDGSAVGGRPRFVGYVLGATRRVYHAGDTIVTDELRGALRNLDVEVALLPINGRDPEREARGIVGNMNAAEAVELALELGAQQLLPYHWDGFTGNTVPPGTAVDAAAARIHVVVPARFTALEL